MIEDRFLRALQEAALPTASVPDLVEASIAEGRRRRRRRRTAAAAAGVVMAFAAGAVVATVVASVTQHHRSVAPVATAPTSQAPSEHGARGRLLKQLPPGGYTASWQQGQIPGWFTTILGDLDFPGGVLVTEPGHRVSFTFHGSGGSAQVNVWFQHLDARPTVATLTRLCGHQTNVRCAHPAGESLVATFTSPDSHGPAAVTVVTRHRTLAQATTSNRSLLNIPRLTRMAESWDFK